MSYSHPALEVTYTFPAVDFGATDIERHIQGPAGKSGRIKHIGVSVTEVFTGVTTNAFVRVGTTADPDAYAELDLGTAAADTYVSDDANAILDGLLPADTDIEIDFVSTTGGTPTGTGDVFLVVHWF